MTCFSGQANVQQLSSMQLSSAAPAPRKVLAAAARHLPLPGSQHPSQCTLCRRFFFLRRFVAVAAEPGGPAASSS